MSKHETPLTRRYWKEIGGTLITAQKSSKPKQKFVGSMDMMATGYSGGTMIRRTCALCKKYGQEE